MSRNNDVYQILVAKGNTAVIAAGSNVTALAPGQLGVFNADTNLSIDGTTAGVRAFYMGLGVDRDGDGATDDVVKSRGSKITKELVKYFTYRPHTPGRSMKVLLKDYTADCDTEYGVKLNLSSQVILRTQGTIPFTKSYFIKTSCCDGCEPTCPSGDANEITRMLVQLINYDKDGLVVARALARTALTSAQTSGNGAVLVGGVVSDVQLLGMMTFNSIQPTTATYVYTDLEIETVPLKVNTYALINLNYFYPRRVFVTVSKVEGFKCTGTVVTTQEQVVEEGSGYDVKQIEYKTMGWDISPFRVSTIMGTSNEVAYLTDAAEKYDLFHLAYEDSSVGGLEMYLNPLATTIASPATSTITRDSLATVLNGHLIGQGFDSLIDDAAAANVNPLIIERTKDKTIATDGIA